MPESDHKIQAREYRTAVLMSATMVSLALFVQLYFSSMFDVDDQAWFSRILIHQDYYPFSARVLTTYPVKWLGALLGGRYEFAFGLYQYTIYFLIGPLFYQYLRRLNFAHRWALGGLLIIYLSYPMLAAFHEPVSSWDDFMQYASLIIAFSSLLSGRFWLSAFAISFAIAAREATVLLFPVWAAAIWFSDPRSTRYKIQLLALPIVVGAFLWFYPDHEPTAVRIHNITENFRDRNWTLNSLYSMAMGLGFLWVLLPSALASHPVAKRMSGAFGFIRYGSVFGVLIVTAVVLNFAYARETRLYFPPFVFVVPLILAFLYDSREKYRSFFSRQYRKITILAILFVILIGTVLSIRLFPHFDYRSELHFAQGIFAAHFEVGILALLPQLLKRSKPGS